MDENTNRVWLVCRYHPEERQSLCLGKRRGTGYFGAPRTQDMDNWFADHASCGGNMDHFAISFSQTPDWKAQATDDFNGALGAVVKQSLNGSH